MIDITGLNKAHVLAALYNRSHPQGWGYLHAVPEDMTHVQAERLLDGSEEKRFDYIQGRVMKVNLSSETEFDPWLYDRDNGAGAAARTIYELRAKT